MQDLILHHRAAAAVEVARVLQRKWGMSPDTTDVLDALTYPTIRAEGNSQ